MSISIRRLILCRVRYLEYEINLDRLRALRCKRLDIRGPEACERQSIVRIHRLFSRCTRRFRGDVGLWLQWIAFSKERGSSNVLSRSIGTAVLVNPLVEDLWILAADWEFTNEGNAKAARALMLRGIRTNSQSERLWVEYFKLELKYLLKVQKRIDLVTTKSSALDFSDDSDDSAGMIALDMAQNEPEQSPSRMESQLPSITESAFFKGEVCRLVLNNALAAFPGRLHLFFDLWAVVEALDARDQLVGFFMDAGREHFADNAEFWKFLKLKGLDTSDADEHLKGPALSAFRLFSAGDNLDEICRVAEGCESSGAVDAFAYCQWIAALLRLGQVGSAVKVADRALQKFTNDPQLAFDRLTAHLVLFREKKDRAQMTAMFRDTLKNHARTTPIRLLFLRFLFAFPDPSDVDVMFAIGDDEEGAAFALETSASKDWTLSRVREFYGKVLLHQGSPRIFQKAIELENEPEKKRKLLEEAIDRFGRDNATFWLQLSQMLTEAGALDEAGHVHWRAKKALRGMALTEYLEALI